VKACELVGRQVLKARELAGREGEKARELAGSKVKGNPTLLTPEGGRWRDVKRSAGDSFYRQSSVKTRQQFSNCAITTTVQPRQQHTTKHFRIITVI
jgi:hypothetical protein